VGEPDFNRGGRAGSVKADREEVWEKMIIGGSTMTSTYPGGEGAT